MKKNIITSIAVSAALLTLCACGESSTVTQSSTASNTAQTTVAEQSGAVATSAPDNGVPADEIYDWSGLQVFQPQQNGANFLRKEDSGFIFWRGKYTGNDRIYYAASRSHLAAEILGQVPALSEVPAYFDEELCGLYSKYFKTCYLCKESSDLTFSRIVDSQEDIRIGEYDFLRMSGKLHGILEEDKTTSVDLPFCALYTITDYNDGDNMPTIIIAFSEGYDPASVADTQTFIDKVIENMDWK